MDENNVELEQNQSETPDPVDVSNAKLESLPRKTIVKFFIIGFISTFLLNVIAIFTYLMTVFSSSWGGGITPVGGMLMAISVLIPLAVFCISIYLVRFRKDIKLTLWRCAKGSLYCTLLTVTVMIIYSLSMVAFMVLSHL